MTVAAVFRQRTGREAPRRLYRSRGAVLASPGILRGVAALRREYGALLALDETTTGLEQLGA